jgi:lambda family phage minor tail protein L
MSDQNTNANIRAASQSLTPGDMIELFTIDLTPIGVNQRFPFTRNKGIVFRGVQYNPVDVMAEGFEYNGQGALPQPKIRVGNATRVMSAAAYLYQDLIGARLYRLKTYKQFLDGGENPDTEAVYAVDIYDFEQKTGHDNTVIEWTLASAMDQEGRLIPGRTILQSICSWRYRVYDGANGFNYDKVQCPYAGGRFFNAKGEEVGSPEFDRCGRRISDCKLRFGGGDLPYGGFPGVGSVNVR